MSKFAINIHGLSMTIQWPLITHIRKVYSIHWSYGCPRTIHGYPTKHTTHQSNPTKHTTHQSNPLVLWMSQDYPRTSDLTHHTSHGPIQSTGPMDVPGLSTDIRPNTPHINPIHWSYGCPRTIQGCPTKHTTRPTGPIQSTGPMDVPGLSTDIRPNTPHVPRSTGPMDVPGQSTDIQPNTPHVPRSNPIHWSYGSPRTIHGHRTKHTTRPTVQSNPLVLWMSQDYPRMSDYTHTMSHAFGSVFRCL